MPDFPLVSVITPCYNGETFLDRFFQSILQQTYPNIELIFINDGSSDRTEEIALSYKGALEKKEYRYTYIYQENAGQAAAINRGLKIFLGKYLTWPDSDDWMTPNCIEKKVEYLENHPEKGWVQCQTATVKEDDISNIVGYMKRKNISNGWLFDDLIFENDIYFAPGGYMVRSQAILETIPSRQIYECKTGQNWQLLLPVAYRYECGFMLDTLYYYVIRKDSHSRAEKDYTANIEKTHRHEDTLRHVLYEIDMPDAERKTYFDKIEIKYIRKRMRLAAQYRKKDNMKNYYSLLKEHHKVNRDDQICFLRGLIAPLDWGFKAASWGIGRARLAARGIIKHD